VPERVLLFCLASGTDWLQAGIPAITVQHLLVRNLVEGNHATQLALTDILVSRWEERMDYYVYVYIDPRNNEEFYFGKGKGSRKTAHVESEADTEKTKRIAAIHKAGLKPIIRVVARGLTEGEAFLVEKSIPTPPLAGTVFPIHSGRFLPAPHPAALGTVATLARRPMARQGARLSYASLSTTEGGTPLGAIPSAKRQFMVNARYRNRVN
jgi:hypothetical protein